jgi:hypothetical protein
MEDRRRQEDGWTEAAEDGHRGPQTPSTEIQDVPETTRTGTLATTQTLARALRSADSHHVTGTPERPIRLGS